MRVRLSGVSSVSAFGGLSQSRSVATFDDNKANLIGHMTILILALSSASLILS